tara:strand:+ start:16188 stop:16649 length:462 start_codon:yes stop_codon:yes gene_type:complete
LQKNKMINKKILLECLDLKDSKALSKISIYDKNFLNKIKNKDKKFLIYCTLEDYIRIKKKLITNKSLNKFLIIENKNKKILKKCLSLFRIFIHCNLRTLTFVLINQKDFYVNTFNPFFQKKLIINNKYNLNKFKLYIKNVYYFFKNNYLIIYE